MSYITFAELYSFDESIEKGRQAKPCPAGEHKHLYHYNCHPIEMQHREGSMAEYYYNLAVGGTTEDGGEKPKKGKEEDEGKSDESIETKNKTEEPVPEHVEHRTLLEFSDRGSDIDVSEAKYIFAPKHGNDTYIENQNKFKKYRTASHDAMMKAYNKEKSDSESVLTAFLDVYSTDDSHGRYDVFATEKEGAIRSLYIGNDNIGEEIVPTDRGYKRADINDIDTDVMTSICESISDAFEEMPFLKEFIIGAMTSKKAGGIAVSKKDGHSTIYLETSEMNLGDNTPMKTGFKPNEWSRGETTHHVPGEFAKSAIVHEITHSYINQIAYDGLEKRFKIISTKMNEENARSNSAVYKVPKKACSDMCRFITSNDCKFAEEYLNYSGGGSKDSIARLGLGEGYDWLSKVATLPNTVMKEAKKVAKEVYGVDTELFMSKVTTYGKTKNSEAIPEAMADVVLNKENATFSNKLIVMSLQRYATFLCGSDDEELEPIESIIKKMKKAQKNSKTTKSIKRTDDKYITFAELYSTELN